MKICCFNSKYLTPLLTNKQKEEKTCMLMSDLNINFTNAEPSINISEFSDNISSHFFAPSILQPTRLKTLINNIFLNSVEFETFSSNLISLISDYLQQLLVLKDFHCKSTVTNNTVYEKTIGFLSITNSRMI